MRGRGGKREGAGRKPAPAGTRKVPHAMRFDPELLAYLRACDNGTAAVEDAVRRSKGFRDWKRGT